MGLMAGFFVSGWTTGPCAGLLALPPCCSTWWTDPHNECRLRLFRRGQATVMVPYLEVTKSAIRSSSASRRSRPPSSVSTHWRAVAADPCFLRRYRARHGGAPPVLGVLHNNPRLDGRFVGTGDPPDRVPAYRFSPPVLCCDRWLVLRGGRWLVLGCHSGRAVLHDGAGRLLVWDPVTDERRHVELPPLRVHGTHHGLNAVLIVDDGGDDEEGCSFRFRIAVASVAQGTAVAAVYSSETGAWGDHTIAAGVWTSLPTERPGAAVGDAVYWLLNDGRVLSLKLHDGSLTTLGTKVPSLYADNVQLTRTTDGEIGLTTVTGSALHILALETDDESGTTSWVVRRTVLLDDEIVPSSGPVEDDSDPRCCVRIVGVHDDGAVVFLWTVHGMFMVRLELESKSSTQMMIKRLHGIDDTHGRFYAVYPFASAFTPR
ncbi:hypothetical protein QOZ80_2BG0173090 [Eleusine coracana subsp. coracana]|nr:hypothetical protein QOZ80_2BG0173090 [Eleusine coracana subsp. coracana]